MLTIQILIGLSVLLFDGFLIYGYRKFGMTQSISALFDKLEEIEEEYIFQAVQVGFSLMVFIASIIASTKGWVEWEILFLPASCVAISFSSLAGDTEEHPVIMRNHTIGAVLGIALAALFTFFSGSMLLTAGLGIVTYIVAKLSLPNHTYWIEFVWFHYVMTIFTIKILM